MYTEFIMSVAPTLGEAIASLKKAIIDNYSAPNIRFSSIVALPEMGKTLAKPDGFLQIVVIAVLESNEPFPDFAEEKKPAIMQAIK